MGSNKFGQAGSANKETRPNLVNLEKFCEQIACGSSHCVAITRGMLYSWGYGAQSQLGRSHNEDVQHAAAEDAEAEGGEGGVPGEGDAADSVTAEQYFSCKPGIVLLGGGKKARSLACGSDHTLVVDDQGDVWTWGMGNYGNLGHGDTLDKARPTAVKMLHGSATIMVAGGAKHSMCVTSQGKVFVWGHGDNGRLGNGAKRGTLVPEFLHTMSHIHVVQVACGEAHSAAISDRGQLYTWGAGSYGRLGHGEEYDAMTPLQVQALAKQPVTSVSLGAFHTLAVTYDNKLLSWGGGQYGKLGHGDTRNRPLPEVVKALVGQKVTLCAAGVCHSMACTLRGTVYSWGSNGAGRIGHQELTSSTPLPAAINTMGSVVVSGQLGGGYGSVPQTDSSKVQSGATANPIAKRAMRRIIQKVSVGTQHSVALSFGGSVWSWGGNNYGQLGLGKDRRSTTLPIQVRHLVGNARVIDIACGAMHTLCCTVRGNLYAWGRGDDYQLGSGLKRHEYIAIQVQAMQGKHAMTVSAGESHSGCLAENGSVYTWGNGDMGKLGHGSVQSTQGESTQVQLPRMVGGALAGLRVIQFSLGLSHSAAVTNSGQVYTWGGGWYGRLGIGSLDNQYVPQRVLGLEHKPCTSVSCGAYHTLAVTQDGELYAWGRGDARLGVPSAASSKDANQMVPVQVSSLRELNVKVRQAVAAEEHSAVVATDGTVWAWGMDKYGRLGRDPGSEEFAQASDEVVKPTMVKGVKLKAYDGEDPHGIVKRGGLASYSNHCIAASASDGTLWAWGSNGSGRLGLGDTKERDTPASMTQLSVNSMGIAGAAAGSTTEAGGKDAYFDADGDADGSTALADNDDSNDLSMIEDDIVAAAIEDYYKNGVVPPLWIVQRQLKSESPESSLAGLQYMAQSLNKSEVDLMAAIIDATAVEDEIKATETKIELTIASTVHKLAGKDTSGSSNVLSRVLSRGLSSKKSDESSMIPRSILSKLPAYTRIFKLLLLNPSYAFRMYTHWIVQPSKNVEQLFNDSKRSKLFVELISSTYPLGNDHCELLFVRLCRMILHKEISMADDFDEWTKQQLPESMYAKLFKWYLQSFEVMTWLRQVIRDPLVEMMRGAKSRTAGGQELNLDYEPEAVYQTLYPSRGGDVAAISNEESFKDPGVKVLINSRLASLAETTLGLWRRIVLSIPSLPRTARLLFTGMLQEISLQFGEDVLEQTQILLARTLVEWLFRPTMSNPEAYSVLPQGFGQIEEPHITNLANVTRLLRHVSSFKPFGKDSPWLAPLNTVIAQQKYQVISMSKQIMTDVDFSHELLMGVIREHIRKDYGKVTVSTSVRVLKFLRYVLHEVYLQLIHGDEDPLKTLVIGSGGLLENQTDVVKAVSFPSENAETMDAQNFELNLNFNIRALDTDKETLNIEYPIISQLKVDPFSNVPLPFTLAPEDASDARHSNLSEVLTDDEDLRSIRELIVALPEFGKNVQSRAALTEALRTLLEDAKKREQYMQAAQVSAALIKVEDLALSNRDLNFVVGAFLDGLRRRAEVQVTLKAALGDYRTAMGDVAEFVDGLKAIKEELEAYSVLLRHGIGSEQNRKLAERNAERLGNAAKLLPANFVETLHTSSKRSTSGLLGLSSSSGSSLSGQVAGAFGQFAAKSLAKRGVIKRAEVSDSDSDSVSTVVIGKSDMKKVSLIFSTLDNQNFQVSIVHGKRSLLWNDIISINTLAKMDRISQYEFRPRKVPCVLCAGPARFDVLSHPRAGVRK